ncbi:hypothetical protein [Blastococcus haudaquaticus]|uniref:Uncharacterized protein n=1 Tax=Blastococcus haudaquaticus TaxID=1938745 RepID=A0A286GYX2_9ACTN|nr:hypothetical protein [Blastococcus haudaquaticus]SOE00406.1 hypothetical protein SAMN06272739_2577 [Blastococcus haudaquaticus]
MWWLWVVGVLVAWLVVASVFGVVVGRSIRLADARRPGVARDVTAADLTPELATSLARAATAPRARRRALPLPPLGIALAAIAVALETGGYLVRLTGGTGDVAQVMSMDAPFSLPRLYVAALFAAAAMAALAGASNIPGRRTWWTAVGVVAAGVAVVKTGSTVHSDAMTILEDAVGGVGAVLVSVAVAAAVVGGLWFLSRTERRDRRRVLGVLALYAVASVGLSALSVVAGQNFGGASNLTAAVTFLEESGEALAGVAFLVAVLVGVAPRLVLPAEWALRRQADAQTLDLPELVPGRSEGTARG